MMTLHICARCYRLLRQFRTLHHKSKYVTTGSFSTCPDAEREIRINEANIQMISKNIHKQVFKGFKNKNQSPDLAKIIKHLKAFGLWDKTTDKLKNIDFSLPEIFGDNLDEHFRQLASKQTRSYNKELDKLLQCEVPERPEKWNFCVGWTRYDAKTGVVELVPFPQEHGVVFDVEVLLSEGDFPTLATAVSPEAWYSWCSELLVSNKKSSTSPSLDDLIPMETNNGAYSGEWLPRVVIGHNVGYDRSFIKEQYLVQGTRLRFVDTMSLHIAVSGLTSLQRILYIANKTGSQRKEVVEHRHDQEMFGHTGSSAWIKESTLNNLSDVYELYCGRGPLDKSTRDVFVVGKLDDVRQDFQNLMNYCASDVDATLRVFQKVWPQFQERFPHPVTFAGMLEMGSAYLPVNSNWERYITSANKAYDELQGEMNGLLQGLARNACKMVKNKSYKDDVWLWDLDWKVREPKYKKAAVSKKGANKGTVTRELAKKQPHMPGYPKWYADLVPKTPSPAAGSDPDPSLLTTQRRIVPKLLHLTWDGYPLHYDGHYGWGYLVPKIYADERREAVEKELDLQEIENNERKKTTANGAPRTDFPEKALLEVVALTRAEWVKWILTQRESASKQKSEALLEQLHSSTGEENRAEVWAKYREATGKENKKKSTAVEEVPISHPGVGPYADVLPGCSFYKLPHKDGGGKRVGNPLAKDFLSKISEGVLKSRSGDDAEVVLRCSKMCSYWKNNMDRITGQMTLYLKQDQLPTAITESPEYDPDGVYGAILPRVITSGTVSRRAVENTWLTASNAYADRVGSELKSMIQSPPGYHFVGADVDAQELWIASLLGDSNFAGIHGCTALSWMLLRGNKAEGTDIHSHMATLVGISRDHAKVFNYGRIYGAGVRFAEQLLRQFNHRLTSQEAKRKAKVMYESTKGKKIRLTYSEEELEREENLVPHQWSGGSESAMFNMLERIAMSKEPRTPVLRCKISKSLEPKNVADDFMTSRVNWVVQSSAVDYLHLMLVSMRWLIEEYGIRGRFCISIHDEVRYLVRSEDRYRAALALQITNLLTRAMFAIKVDMGDLPQSVAFFSAVDIDKCLRKEVMLDCVTPSNPKGLSEGYEIPKGEALSMLDVLDKTGGHLEEIAPGSDAEHDIDVEDMLHMSDHLLR